MIMTTRIDSWKKICREELSRTPMPRKALKNKMNSTTPAKHARNTNKDTLDC